MKKILATAIVVAILLSCKLNVNAAGLEDIFSAKYYADTYEDLYEAFEYNEAKLLKHVKEYGLKEKRDISPILDVVYYRETYPDLDAAFGDDWDAYVNHWFEYGIKEGRDNGTNFDIIRYVNSYADLREAFDEDYEALANHYLTYGINENRTMALKPQPAPVQSGEVGPQEPINYVNIKDADGKITATYIYDNKTGELLAYNTYSYNADGLVETANMYNGDGSFIGRLSYSYNEDGSYVENASYADGWKYTDVYNKDDRLMQSTYYYDDGGRSVTDFDVNTGDEIKRTDYDAEGNVCYISEYTYEDGILISDKVIWPENGDYSITEYDKETGKRSKQTYYNPDGSVGSVTEYYYEGNKEVGRKTTWPDGSYSIEECHENGNLSKRTYYDSNNVKLYEDIYDEEGNFMETINYDENGNVVE